MAEEENTMGVYRLVLEIIGRSKNKVTLEFAHNKVRLMECPFEPKQRFGKL